MTWDAAVGRLIALAIVASLLVLPVVALVLVMRTRWFRHRSRVFWAGGRFAPWRDPMEELPPPLDEWPRPRGTRRRD